MLHAMTFLNVKFIHCIALVENYIGIGKRVNIRLMPSARNKYTLYKRDSKNVEIKRYAIFQWLQNACTLKSWRTV